MIIKFNNFDLSMSVEEFLLIGQEVFEKAMVSMKIVDSFDLDETSQEVEDYMEEALEEAFKEIAKEEESLQDEPKYKSTIKDTPFGSGEVFHFESDKVSERNPFEELRNDLSSKHKKDKCKCKGECNKTPEITEEEFIYLFGHNKDFNETDKIGFMSLSEEENDDLTKKIIKFYSDLYQ